MNEKAWNFRRYKLPVYPVLPKINCDKGCTDCCGPVTASDGEMKLIRQYIRDHKITPQKNGITCPLAIEGACSIYPARPFICRMFGHTKQLFCDHGYNINLPAFKSDRLIDKYIREHRPNILLHSLVYTDAEIMELIPRGELAATEAEMQDAKS